MTNEKILFGFSYSKNMANFKAFLWNFSSSTNPEIVRNAQGGGAHRALKFEKSVIWESCLPQRLKSTCFLLIFFMNRR